MKDILKIAFILFVVCGLAAGSLSFVNLATKDRIAAFAKEEKLAAFQKIFPAAESFTEQPPADGGEVRDWDAVAGGAVGRPRAPPEAHGLQRDDRAGVRRGRCRRR